MRSLLGKNTQLFVGQDAREVRTHALLHQRRGSMLECPVIVWFDWERPSVKLAARTWKSMVGRLISFWGLAFFQRCTVSSRKGFLGWNCWLDVRCLGDIGGSLGVDSIRCTGIGSLEFLLLRISDETHGIQSSFSLAKTCSKDACSRD